MTATSKGRDDILAELTGIPPTCSSYGVQTRNVLFDLGCSRAELLAVIGQKPVVIGGWSITYDEDGDWVRWRRVTQPPAARAVATTPGGVPFTRPTPAAIDPVKVGKAAQEFQISERKAGREISTTQAVAHIIAQQTAR